MSDQNLSALLHHIEADNERLRRLLDAQDARAELRHQTRNTLSTIRALIRLSAQTSTTIEDYAAHLEGRFDVILRVQNTIIHHRERVDFHSLIADELHVFGAHEGKRIQLSGPRLSLQPRAAEIFALTFHELATNAVKFGALSVPDGKIEVSWRVDVRDAAEPQLAFQWRESGLTNHGSSLQHRGFGREVIEYMLPYELKAKTGLSLGADGLHCDIAVPFPSSIGAIVEESPEPQDTATADDA